MIVSLTRLLTRITLQDVTDLSTAQHPLVRFAICLFPWADLRPRSCGVHEGVSPRLSIRCARVIGSLNRLLTRIDIRAVAGPSTVQCCKHQFIGLIDCRNVGGDALAIYLSAMIRGGGVAPFVPSTCSTPLVRFTICLFP